MAEALALGPAARAWSLAALADEAEFDLHIHTVATAIADRFTLKVHQNIVSRRMAFIAWIDSLAADDGDPLDYRNFVAVCASLIASIARHRVVNYSAMIRDPANRMIDAVLKYPNEVTALAAGAAIYELRVSDMTGAPSGGALPALIIENAAANLSRHPEAAAKFRELLQLGTPWT
jgi:hypothetical protein